ncbi:uncharacterized protein LOC116738590 [Nasonia vitripennis]|uniref:MATH domain-containing protein n=1 Tax=Nasonia vitripennis TaxID=7425 RepID=A0A7M7QZK7_NASVI|nr:uncharacterized protein LOC116738590 [Nasonia vitripennis]XP_032456032.1 uncharacterized protein LOC116738590 [Nasonia vitripennis]
MELHDTFNPSLEIKEDLELESGESNAKFLWFIKFRNHADSDDLQMMNVLESPVFHAKHDSATKWKLKLYPNGCENEFNGYASIFLFLMSRGVSQMQAYLKLSISKGNGAFIRFAIFDTNMHHGESLAVVGFSKFVKSSYFAKNYNGIHRRCCTV